MIVFRAKSRYNIKWLLFEATKSLLTISLFWVLAYFLFPDLDYKFPTFFIIVYTSAFFYKELIKQRSAEIHIDTDKEEIKIFTYEIMSSGFEKEIIPFREFQYKSLTFSKKNENIRKIFFYKKNKKYSELELENDNFSPEEMNMLNEKLFQMSKPAVSYQH